MQILESLTTTWVISRKSQKRHHWGSAGGASGSLFPLFLPKYPCWEKFSALCGENSRFFLLLGRVCGEGTGETGMSWRMRGSLGARSWDGMDWGFWDQVGFGVIPRGFGGFGVSVDAQAEEKEMVWGWIWMGMLGKAPGKLGETGKRTQETLRAPQHRKARGKKPWDLGREWLIPKPPHPNPPLRPPAATGSLRCR